MPPTPPTSPRNGESPSPLKHSSARLLEFESVREMLLGYAASALGRARLAALQPSDDLAWIEQQQILTEEVRAYWRAGGRFEFAELTDLQLPLARSRIVGAALDTEGIRDVVTVVDRAAEWRQITLRPPAAMAGKWPAVEALSAGIVDFTEFLRFFRNKLLPDGTLDDRASPELARVRREIEKQKRNIQESLRSYLRRLAEGGAVQDEVISIRGERFVIPVKVEQKKRVSGVVHGASSTGQTVFVEPLETIEQNNELVRLLEEEQAEVRRILLEMTRRIAAESEHIAAATGVLAELELQFAKARFAEAYECVPVQFGGARSGLVLKQARHPMLERNLRNRGSHMVPVGLELSGEHRQLVISGPNTGGKTVALKTVGLLSLMAQSGIPVPAEVARLPLFDAVLADLGDYQSIEQNLSTFSAHVTNIDAISRRATRDSLVLLDELGSATDPEEGAALAVAIADHFRQTGAITIISTHHTSLKVYGANTPGVVNAAVGFEEATLQPTYELRIGVPGASAGINIAHRLGLNPSIVDSARSRLKGQTQDISRFLDRLHTHLRELEQERLRLSQREAELQREKSRLESVGLQEQRAKVRDLEKKLELVLEDFEYQAREAVSNLQEKVAAQKLNKESERRIAKLRREFKEQFDSALVAHRSGADQDDPRARPGEVKNVSEGDTVKLKSLGRGATVVRRLSDDLFEVEAGAMKMKVPRSDIAEVIQHAKEGAAVSPVAAARSRGIKISLQSEETAAASEINVIGENVDDATRRVEQFVDRAFLAGLSHVRIVHGSGMGVLRKSLRQFLKGHPHVAAVSEPPQHEGGAGATLVELRT